MFEPTTTNNKIYTSQYDISYNSFNRNPTKKRRKFLPTFFRTIVWALLGTWKKNRKKPAYLKLHNLFPTTGLYRSMITSGNFTEKLSKFVQNDHTTLNTVLVISHNPLRYLRNKVEHLFLVDRLEHKKLNLQFTLQLGLCQNTN